MLKHLVAGIGGICGKVKEAGRSAFNYVVNKVNAVTAVVIGTGAAVMHSAVSEVHAAAGELPEMPIDFADLAAKGLVVVGVVLGAIAGIVIIVSLCRMGLNKLSSAWSGRG